MEYGSSTGIYFIFLDSAADELLGSAYYTVRWSERLYLVREEAMAEFCVHAKQAAVRPDGPGVTVTPSLCYLRHGDENTPVKGLPDVPRAFRIRFFDFEASP